MTKIHAFLVAAAFTIALTILAATDASAAQARTASPAAGVYIQVPYVPAEPALSVPTADPGVATWQRIQARERRRAILSC